MSEHWPSTDVAWVEPEYVPTNTRRWQSAIDDALVDGSLHLDPGAQPDFMALVGSCPRCDHPLRQTLQFEVIRGIDDRFEPEVGRFNIDCACPDPHEGRPAGRVGCGWGGPVPVTVRRGA